MLQNRAHFSELVEISTIKAANLQCHLDLNPTFLFPGVGNIILCHFDPKSKLQFSGGRGQGTSLGNFGNQLDPGRVGTLKICSV